MQFELVLWTILFSAFNTSGSVFVCVCVYCAQLYIYTSSIHHLQWTVNPRLYCRIAYFVIHIVPSSIPSHSTHIDKLWHFHFHTNVMTIVCNLYSLCRQSAWVIHSPPPSPSSPSSPHRIIIDLRRCSRAHEHTRMHSQFSSRFSRCQTVAYASQAAAAAIAAAGAAVAPANSCATKSPARSEEKTVEFESTTRQQTFIVSFNKRTQSLFFLTRILCAMWSILSTYFSSILYI